MRISTDELRRAVETLLQHLEKNGQKEFELNEDFYWDVPLDRRYLPYDHPTQLTIGQLSDDWSEVAQMVDGRRETVAYGLVWLSAILRRVGEKATG